MPQPDERPHDPWHERIASELRSIAGALEDLGGRLCSDEAVIARHLEALQAIDALSQRERALADLVEAHDREAALENCPLHDLSSAMGRPHAA